MIGKTLSHYRILEKIGAGGMGEVYRAHDERLERDVALKVLPAGTLADEAARKRFRREALALSKLNHPNIQTVFDFDTQEGVDFLVTEYVAGALLDEKLAAGPLPEKEIASLGSQIAAALEEAHERGVVHRDLKPGNIKMTPKSQVKVLDFGIAKLLTPTGPTATTQSFTETQAVAGTLPYMAPEQLRGQPADPRSDLYSLGVVLYEMATGRRPFEERLVSALTDAILHQPPPPPGRLKHDLSARLEEIILKCLEKEPENRYQSAKELAVDLRRLLAPSAVAAPVVPARRWGRRSVLAAAGIAVVLLAVLAALWLGRGAKGPASLPGTPSIAVLPFVDMSPEKNQEYFSDGLAEELLNRLTKMPELRVVARTSSFQFKGKNEDVRVVGQKLNVATILEGSVRKEGNRVRITAQLINVADGFHLWSETYDRELNDIFAVQEEIARSVAGSLKVALLGGKTAAPAVQGTNAEAYNAYLQGQYFYLRRSKEDLERAVGYYEQAIKLDPGYAPAWAGLARAYSRQAEVGYVPVEEGNRKVREAAERALALDANLAEAHAVMGGVKQLYDWDWVGADASYQRALALEPGSATIIVDAAMLAGTLGHSEEALKLARRAVELDPLNVSAHFHLGLVAYYGGGLEEAVAALKKVLELNPERPAAHTLLGQVYLAQAHPEEALVEMEREPEPVWRLTGLALAYHALGRKKESDAALAELVAKYQTESAFQIAEVYAFRGEADRAFEWLERAYAQRDGGLTQMKGDPLLKNLERDPRYPAFLKKMRLPT